MLILSLFLPLMHLWKWLSTKSAKQWINLTDTSQSYFSSKLSFEFYPSICGNVPQQKLKHSKGIFFRSKNFLHTTQPLLWQLFISKNNHFGSIAYSIQVFGTCCRDLVWLWRLELVKRKACGDGSFFDPSSLEVKFWVLSHIINLSNDAHRLVYFGALDDFVGWDSTFECWVLQ